MSKQTDNEAFVRAYQATNGLKVDGWAGRDTFGKLTRSGDVFDIPQKPNTSEIDPNDLLLIKDLERDEGRVLHAYQDSLGWWTIGIGRLIDKRKGGGITNAEADYLKANDIAKFKVELDKVAPWWRSVSPARQRAIQNLAFNLGAGGLVQKWPNTVALMRAGKWHEAAAAIRANKVWVGQVGARAERVAKQIEEG